MNKEPKYFSFTDLGAGIKVPRLRGQVTQIRNNLIADADPGSDGPDSAGGGHVSIAIDIFTRCFQT